MIALVAILLAQAAGGAAAYGSAGSSSSSSSVSACNTAGNTTICYNDTMSVTCVRTGNVVKCETIRK